MKTKILTILRESDTYVSGQQLCDALGVSRTAVWKVMNQLKAEGYRIEAVQNKGYKLVSAPELLSESEIKSRLHTQWAGQKLYYYQETETTNNDCRHAMEQGSAHGTLVVAEMQTGGKGRRGRGWVSPSGMSIYMTLGLKPDFMPDRASMLTLVMALAVCRSIEDVSGLAAAIKWPNDVVVHKKKVCGILTEMSAERDYINNVVIGVGINVNQTEFPEELAQTATSLVIEAAKAISRVQIVQKTMEYFEALYEVFVEKGDLSSIMEEYNEKLVNRDAEVRVLDPKGAFEGVSRGINALGELVVEKPNGEIENIYAGEVSVRGMYGYV